MSEKKRSFGRPGGGHGPGGHMQAGEKAKDFKSSIKKLARVLSRYKFSLLLVVIFAAAGAIFSIIGPKVLGNATTEIFNGLISKISGGAGIDFGKIATILLTLLGLYLASALFSFIQGVIMGNVSQKVSYGLRRDISIKIEKLPMSYYDKHTYGETLSRITNDIDTLTQSMNQSMSQVISSICTLVGVLAMMFSISWSMTLLAIVLLPISLGLVMLIVKKSQKHFRAQQEYTGHINGHVEEAYGGHNVIKLFNNEQKSIEEFDALNHTLASAARKSQFLSGIMMPIMSLVGNLGYVGVSILGGILAMQGTITVGEIQSFIQYVRSFTQPINQIAQITNQLQSTAAAAERIFEFLEEEEEPSSVQNPASTQDIQGHVTFDHVHFGYSEDKIIINDFSADIAAGKKIAIVGPTGAGKTTMVKLLMRFYDVNSGRILVDGVDIRDYDRTELRRCFGMVLQDTWLFS
ncbi:MAG: ABC transporter ATP-binding protein, partial [Clostridiales bacterium]|nr:ABC transporter ATP-binding protein [Clostridiales bacterium]